MLPCGGLLVLVVIPKMFKVPVLVVWHWVVLSTRVAGNLTSRSSTATAWLDSF